MPLTRYHPTKIERDNGKVRVYFGDQDANDRMNNPDYYQLEDPHKKGSHIHEMSADEQGEEQEEENGQEM